MNFFLSVDDVSTYYLLANALIFIGYLSNFEFGTITTREYFSSDKRCESFSAHFTHLFLSCFIGFVIVVQYIDFLNLSELVFFCSFLFIFDYINKDLERWLVLHGKPIASALSLFIRSSAWVYILIPFAYYYNDKGLEQFYLFAIAFNIFSFIFNIFNNLPFFIENKLKIVESTYLIMLFKKVLPVFMAAILVKLLFTLDINILALLDGDKIELASYLYYFSFAFMIITFVEILIFSFDFPKLLSSYKVDNLKAFQMHKGILKKVFIVAFSSFLVISLVSYFSIFIIKKDSYLSYYLVSIILNLSVLLYSIFQTYRYWFYVSSNDAVNLVNMILVFGLFCFSFLFFFLLLDWISTSFAVSFSLLISLAFGVSRYIYLHLRFNEGCYEKV